MSHVGVALASPPLCRRYFLCRLKPLSKAITRCDVEVAEAAWRPVQDVLASSSPMFIKAGVRMVTNQPIFADLAEYADTVVPTSGLSGQEEVARLGNKHIAVGAMSSFLDKRRRYKLFYPAAALPAK